MLGELFGRLIGFSEDATEVHTSDAFLAELAMSHGDLANLLRAALKAQHPGPDIYCWVRDVFDAEVVYEISNRDDVSRLYQRSYTIDDNGAVNLGEPVAVIAVTSYVAATEADRGDGLTERAFTQDQRDAMAKSGEAMSDGGFPIATKGDLRNAVKAYGRAVNKPAVKRHIVKRAKALGATDALPEDWRPSAESDREELTGDLVPLVEKAVKSDGTIAIKVISPGQGSSGYYGVDMLKRDGPKVFTAGLHMYADHPSLSEESDRPERSIKDLVGTLTSDARWEDAGAAGPGLYAEAKLRSDVAPLIEELAPSIGVSIRALGKASAGEVDGKKVRVIDAIEQAKSVDFVTVPGAGGRVLDLIEAARQGITPAPVVTEDDEVSKEELEAAREKIAESEREIAELKQWKDAQERRAAEAALIREAHTVVVEQLAGIQLPAPTRERLTGQLAADPPTKDGALDREALVAKVKEAAAAEVAYLASVTGGTGVRGMGGEPPKDPETPALDESEKRIEAALAAL